MRDEELLNKTKIICDSSTFKKGNGFGSRVSVAASIYYKNKLISAKTNVLKSHPAQNHYNKYRSFDAGCHLHAEVNCIIEAAKNTDKYQLEHSTIYIARKLNNGQFADSRPCQACMQAIRESGIKKMVYSTTCGYAIEYIKER